jgi:hypothetical protein
LSLRRPAIVSRTELNGEKRRNADMARAAGLLGGVAFHPPA